MSTIIESIEQGQLRDDVPVFKAGDTLRVHFKVIEGTRQRVQVFEGVCIKRQGSGARETFTVRKISFGVGVERDVPGALAEDREARGRDGRRHQPGEALLPPRPRRQEGAHPRAPHLGVSPRASALASCCARVGARRSRGAAGSVVAGCSAEDQTQQSVRERVDARVAELGGYPAERSHCTRTPRPWLVEQRDERLPLRRAARRRRLRLVHRTAHRVRREDRAHAPCAGGCVLPV